MRTINELEQIGYTACDFGGYCDKCKKPKGITLMSGYVNDECGEEHDYDICQKCASESFESRKAYLES